MSGRVFGYTFGRVPTWLLDAAVSDRAVQLFALLTRYADREGRGFRGRRALSERVRWDVAGDGGRLTNDYFLLEHRDGDPHRIDAPPAATLRLPRPQRCGPSETESQRNETQESTEHPPSSLLKIADAPHVLERGRFVFGGPGDEAAAWLEDHGYPAQAQAAGARP